MYQQDVPNKHARGFSIVEVMVAILILSIVSIGVMALIDSISKATVTQKFGNNTLNLVEEIRSTLGSPQACLTSFGGFDVTTATVFTHPLAKNQEIFDNAIPPNLRYQVGTMDVDKTLKVNKMTFTNYIATPGSNNYGQITLEIGYTAIQQADAPYRHGDLLLQTQINPATRKIIGCVSLAKMSDTIWQIVPNTSYDIFFNGLTNTNVGIGSTSPKTLLDMGQGSLHLGGDLSTKGGGPKPWVTSAVTGKLVSIHTDPGAYMGYNILNSIPGSTVAGETDFVNQKGPNNGGFAFFGGDDLTNPLMFMDQKSNQVGIGTIYPRSRVDLYDGTYMGAAISLRSVDNLYGFSYFGDKYDAVTGSVTVFQPPMKGYANGLGFVQKVGTFQLATAIASAKVAGDFNNPLAGPQGSIDAGQIGMVSNHHFQLYTQNRPRLSVWNTGGMAIGKPHNFADGTPLEQVVTLQIYGDADFTGTVSATTVTTSSDIRLKRDILPLQNSLENICRLEGKSYYWKDVSRGASLQMGLVAQDVEKVFPEAVVNSSSGLKSINYIHLIAPLIEAVKALYAKVTGVDERVQDLALQLKSTQAQLELMRQQNAELQGQFRALKRELLK